MTSRKLKLQLSIKIHTIKMHVTVKRSLIENNKLFFQQKSCYRLHNEELYALYSSPNIIRVMKSRRLRWAGHVARTEEKRGAYRALVGKPEERRPLGKPRRRWEDNIKTDLREVRWGHRLDRSGSG
jgi:hypothetical protein